MIEKIFLEELTRDKVNISKKQYITVDGAEYQIGNIHRYSYVNSVKDRTLLSENLSDPYYSAVMLIWGNSATVEDI